MATYTPEAFNKKIQDRLRSLKVNEIIVYPAATATLDKLRQRLFQKGIKGDGSKTGNYSTEPMYASKKQFKKTGGFRAQGKNAGKTASGKLAKGTKKKKDGTERKSMYLAGGYKELRQVQGMETGFVNLQYNGDLFTDFTKLTVQKDSVVVKVSRGINEKKIDGLTKKYGSSTFKHSKEEREFLKKEVQKNLVSYLNN